jgi:hypothetical protein
VAEAALEQEVCVDAPSVGLGRSEAEDVRRATTGDRVERRRAAEEGEARPVRPPGHGVGDDAVELAHERAGPAGAEPLERFDSRRRHSASVLEEQLERAVADAASGVHVLDADLHACLQLAASPHDPGWAQRADAADANRAGGGHRSGRGQTRPLVSGA